MPYRLRYRLAWDHALSRAVLGVYVRALLAFYTQAARQRGIRDGHTGTVIQRFGYRRSYCDLLHEHSLDRHVRTVQGRRNGAARGSSLAAVSSAISSHHTRRCASKSLRSPCTRPTEYGAPGAVAEGTEMSFVGRVSPGVISDPAQFWAAPLGAVDLFRLTLRSDANHVVRAELALGASTSWFTVDYKDQYGESFDPFSSGTGPSRVRAIEQDIARAFQDGRLGQTLSDVFSVGFTPTALTNEFTLGATFGGVLTAFEAPVPLPKDAGQMTSDPGLCGVTLGVTDWSSVTFSSLDTFPAALTVGVPDGTAIDNVRVRIAVTTESGTDLAVPHLDPEYASDFDLSITRNGHGLGGEAYLASLVTPVTASYVFGVGDVPTDDLATLELRVDYDCDGVPGSTAIAYGVDLLVPPDDGDVLLPADGSPAAGDELMLVPAESQATTCAEPGDCPSGIDRDLEGSPAAPTTFGADDTVPSSTE